VDPAILEEEGGAGLEQQLQAVRQLGLTCMEDHPEIRPTMVDVTKELGRIERSIAWFFSHLISWFYDWFWACLAQVLHSVWVWLESSW